MRTKTVPKRHNSTTRSLGYLFKRWVLRRPFLTASVPDLGLRFRIKTEDSVGRRIYKYQSHEPELSAFLLRNLEFSEGDVIFDIGANIGWCSLLLSQGAPPGAQIFSFEPDPLNFSLLEQNIALNQAHQIKPIARALGAEVGTKTLYRHDSRNFGRHSLFELQEGDPIDVEVGTLNHFWQTEGLGDRIPRFIKIDVEGYELMVLQGATEILKRCPAVLCEFAPNYMRTGGLNPADLFAFMIDLGFKPHTIGPSGAEAVEFKTLLQQDKITDVYWENPAAG